MSGFRTMTIEWHGFMTPLILAIVYLQWNVAEADWVLSSKGVSCDATCTGLSETCASERMQLITSEEQMNFAVTSGSLTSCALYVAGDDALGTAQPYQIDDYIDGLSGLPVLCFVNGLNSICAASDPQLARLCCCYNGVGDVGDQCPVPTTTSTTATVTTSTSSTFTTTSTTETTQTTLTTTLTTMTSVTTTATTETTSSITDTTSSVTTTSSTFTTTSILTETTTATTQTTSSQTETTSTATTITTTSVSTSTTTLTTTGRPSTSLVVLASAGDTQIVVADAGGFSVNDMIKLKEGRTEEYVEIISQGTISARRLATYPTFQVSPPLVNSYGVGATITNFGPASLFTGGDPVTYFGGTKWKFWMPLHQELLLLATPEIRLYGKAFPGPEIGQQWFDEFLVAFPDDTSIVKVRVKQHESNGTAWISRRCSSPRFETLQIHLGQDASPLKDMRHLEYTAGKSVRFEVNCRNQAARTEYLYFETPSLVFVITSSHAYVDFRDRPELAFKYMHLDFIVMEALRPQTFSGILPEIWDLQPRSALVNAMLQPPEGMPQPSVTPEPVQVCEAKAPADCVA